MPDLTTFVQSNHPYDVPEVISFKVGQILLHLLLCKSFGLGLASWALNPSTLSLDKYGPLYVEYYSMGEVHAVLTPMFTYRTL